MKISIDERSLPRIQRWGMIALALVLTLMLGGYFTLTHMFSRQAASLEMEKTLMAQQETLLQTQTQEVASYLDHVRSRTETVLQEQIRDQVEQALQVLTSLHQQHRHTLPEAQLRRMLVETLRPVRFLGGRGYYFIDDLEGNCILLPNAPEREGTSLLDNRDDQGTYIMRNLIEAVSNPDGFGFTRYRWYAPGRPGMQDKIAYAALFKPYNWIVGTGEYVFKVEEDLQAEALARIRSLRFGEDGYIAVLTRDGMPLVSPSTPSSESRPLNTLPHAEQEVIRQIVRKASEGGGILHYTWVNPRTGQTSPKMSFVHTMPAWGWILVSGVYMDDIHSSLARQQASLQEDLQQSLLFSLLVLALAMVLALAFSAYYSRWFKHLFNRYQAAIQESHQALSLNKFLMDHAGDICLLLDEEKRVIYSNRAAQLLLGRSAEALQAQPLEALALSRLGELEQAETTELAYPSPDGRLVHLEARLSPADYQGQPYYCIILRDITQRREQEERLHLAAHVFESGQEGMMVCDAGQRILAVNQSFLRLTGFTLEESLGQTSELLKSSYHGPSFFQDIQTQLEDKGAWSGEIWWRRKTGDIFPAWVNINRVCNSQGETTHYITAFSDISQQKESEARVRHLSEHDTLTNLPNRNLLQVRLQQALEHARREGSLVAVLWIDLDRFKIINDSLGHNIGDQFLIETAQRLHSQIRARDTISRQGGDEFAVILSNLENADQAALIARKIQEQVGNTTWIAGHELAVTPSIGIALFPGDGETPDSLLKNAEAAMYHAKQQGRNNCQFFTPAINERFNERLNLEHGLRHALQEGELQLHYQPQFDLCQGKLTGCEALLRWTSPELGPVSPARFIPIAEESGLIEAIGDWVVHQACAQIALWQQQGLPPCPVAINVSALQFRNGSIVRTLAQALESSGIAAHLLELEVTESVLAEDTQRITQQLKALKSMGVSLAIDDFGTGYSSLSYLKRFPLDRLKIDRSFIQDLPADPDDAAITLAIIEMARALGLSTLAEGVETQEQHDYLLQHGCEQMQGYLRGKPMPASEFSQLLEGKAATPAA